MDENNNNNNTSFTPTKQNNILNENEKIYLPPIITESFKNLSKVNKICQYEKIDNLKLKLKYPTFLTSNKGQIEKINIYNPNNNINNDDKIYELLKGKIEIKNINKNNNCNKNKNMIKNNNIKTYINEACLYKNANVIKKERNKLKTMKVGVVFTSPNFSKKNINNNEEDLNYKNSIDLRIYKNMINNKNNERRLKTLDKKYVKNDISGDVESNWRKKINCSLRYRHNKNKISIYDISETIKNLNKLAKKAFDGFKKETDIIFDEALNIKEKKGKRKIK